MDTKETEEQIPEKHSKASEEKTEKELDPDTEVHKKGPDLITKESHHLDVDDEVKKG